MFHSCLFHIMSAFFTRAFAEVMMVLVCLLKFLRDSLTVTRSFQHSICPHCHLLYKVFYSRTSLIYWYIMGFPFDIADRSIGYLSFFFFWPMMINQHFLRITPEGAKGFIVYIGTKRVRTESICANSSLNTFNLN